MSARLASLARGAGAMGRCRSAPAATGLPRGHAARLLPSDFANLGAGPGAGRGGGQQGPR